MQPLKHVETRKNVVLNSKKTKDFCRIYDIKHNPHAQKLFVIIVASGSNAASSFYVYMTEYMDDGDGDRRWRSSLKPFKAGVRGRPGSRYRAP